MHAADLAAAAIKEGAPKTTTNFGASTVVLFWPSGLGERVTAKASTIRVGHWVIASYAEDKAPERAASGPLAAGVPFIEPDVVETVPEAEAAHRFADLATH